MDQSGKNFRIGQPLQVRAGLAESEAARLHVADPKLATDKMIQRHAARDDVAAAVAKSVIDIQLSLHRFDRFSFDQGQLAIGLRLVVSALAKEIAIAFEASAGNGACFANRLHMRLGSWSDVD